MFEDKTYERLLNDKLAQIPDAYDKREGSVLFNALAPNAMETAELYRSLDWVQRQLAPQTADFEHLKMLAEPFGVFPKVAEPFVVIGEFDTPIQLGARFNDDVVNFRVVAEAEGVQCYELVAETPGRYRVAVGDSLAPIEPIEGLTKAVIKEIIMPGTDDEDYKAFYQRFFIESRRQAYGGNIADYERICSTIAGVGAVQVTPHWKGPGTVLLTIVDTDFTVPAAELVSKVQMEIDPQSGSGIGLAPIDHKVTVQAAQALKVSVGLHLSYQSGYSWDVIEAKILEVLEAYFTEVRKEWKGGHLYIYISQIESRILKVSGVLDISHTTLNGAEDNISVPNGQVPVVGDVSES